MDQKSIEAQTIVEDIITSLDDNSLNDLLEGSGNDIDTLLSTLYDETYSLLYGNKVSIYSPNYTESLSRSIEEKYRINSLTYFITSVLPDFQLNTHHIQWGELVLKYDKLCILAARDSGKSYYFSHAYIIWQMYRYTPKNRIINNRGYLFSFSLQQAVDLLDIIKSTIETNPILIDKLMPTSKDGAWASTNIVCKNNARLSCKGFGSSVRGAHPYYIIVDDGLKDNVLYSSIQRNKITEYFHASIMNMIIPGGQVIVVGTPFHSEDLYGNLKSKSIFDSPDGFGWACFEYPSIFPDGQLLWEDRWNYRGLMEKRATQGNLVFSRENLCRPISNESSIFPMKILEKSTLGMEKYTLVMDRPSFPIKFPSVVVGCDLALSGNVGADYSVFTVWGVAEDGVRYLMYMYREKGKTFAEQIQQLKNININFTPDVFFIENNVFQQFFVQEADRIGLPVVGHTTGVEKSDLKKGWPSLSVDFERFRIKIPIGDRRSEAARDLIFQDLGSVAFTEKGLESTGGHDDISSSFWLAQLAANRMTTGFKFGFV